jgi:hypothetical protein
MSSSRLHGILGALLAAALLAPGRAATPRFYPDDPIQVDRDTLFDASGAQPIELSEAFDFLENTFAAPPDAENIRALNVNTVDEVPDSSWFTNRIGRGGLSTADLVRGPDRFERLDVDEWVIVRDKGPAGFQPGFRAFDARNPDQLYQLEVDLKEYRDLSSGAELIGTTIYHAIGYNVVDVYLVDVDPAKIRIAETATTRDASGRRPYRPGDLEDVLEAAERNPDGSYRMTAGRFVEGEPMGNFKYYGTRADDPNDIYPHEHRRELRANRVFAAWLNHDDSRALNTLDMRVPEGDRKWIRHYMFDFGSILGNTPDRRASGHAYLLERRSTVAGLLSLGLWVPPWHVIDYPDDLRRSVGLFEGDAFDPKRWKPEYPNRAFDNMRADDAFWAARIVGRFSDAAIRAVVGKARYSDPRAGQHVADALIKRRDKILAAWLTSVNPIADPSLDRDGVLVFENAAVAAGGATPPTEYVLTWSRFDNGTDAAVGPAAETRAERPNATAPMNIIEDSEFMTVSVSSLHPDYPGWKAPVRLYFRRASEGWQTVGLERTLQ